MKFKIKPWAHQLEAINKASLMEGYALFFEVGTGKTLTAVNIIRAKCYQKKRILRTLILCPPVVKENWKREFLANSTIDPRKIDILEGPSKNRIKFLDESNNPIVITNYESLGIKELFQSIKNKNFEAIVFDESHLLKNFRAKRTKAAIELADKSEFKLLLTGTPILNTPMDIWSQFRILDGGKTFDRNFFAFRARYFFDKNAGMPSQKYFPNWQPIKELDKIFNAKIYKKAARVLKKDCLDLPPFVRKRVFTMLSPEQHRMYESMKKSFIAYLEDKACVAQIALTRALRLQQILCGFFVDDEDNVHKFEKNPRLEALKDILESIGQEHKIIIWTTFRDTYADIENLLLDMGIGYSTLYGGMTDRKRQDAVDNFNLDPNYRVLVANQAAGGTGVNLTAATYAIYFSRTYSLQDDTQSEGRCYRGGSEVHEKITRIDIVAPDTLDEIILDCLARKENLANNILRIKDSL